MAVDKKVSELDPSPGLAITDLFLSVKGDTDYKFTGSQLMTFVNALVNVGANVTFQNDTPANGSGKNGDVVIKPASGQFLQRVNGVWVLQYTVPAQGTGNTIIYGLTAPNNGTGNNGDTYVQTDGGIFYKKAAGVWTQQFSMATGPAGPRGNSVLNGTVDPAGGTGNNGDFYYNTTTETMFGPKTLGLWGAGTLLKGSDGKTVLNGTTPPSNDIGSNGDFYINTNTLVFYGPKSAGVWPAGTSLVNNAPAYKQAYNYLNEDTTVNSQFSYNSGTGVLTFTLTPADQLIFPFDAFNGILGVMIRDKVSSNKFKIKTSYEPIVTDNGANYTTVEIEAVDGDLETLQLILT